MHTRSACTLIFIACLLGAFSPLFVSAEKLSRTVKFDAPDIRDDFCGVKIDYRICKCARHDEMCKDIGRERAVASFILNSRYDAYVAGLRAAFAANCLKVGGKFGQDACRYYEKDKKETECLPEDFNTNWKKYSDIDDAIPEHERSFEAKSYAETFSKAVQNTKTAYLLMRDMEVDRLMRLEMREMKNALVKNLRVNLLKSFWRLAWVTYDTIAGASVPFGKEYLQGAVSTGQTFAKLFDGAEHWITRLGAGLNVMRTLVPANSRIAIDTEKAQGKLASLALTGGIATLENVVNLQGAPQVGIALFGEIANLPMPDKADITDEEVSILKEQYVKNRLFDDVLQESYRRNRERRIAVENLKAENETLKGQLAEWEQKERDRVQSELMDACKK